MKTRDILKSFTDSTVNDQLEMIRDIRRNRFTVKTASAVKKVKAETKKKVDVKKKLLSSVSKAELIKLLKEQSGNG